MAKLFEVAARISNPLSLSAFVVAAIVTIVLCVLRVRRRKVPAIAWASIAAIVLVGMLPILARLPDPIYRVRVTVLDAQHVPVDDAKVWSSMGGEAKKVAGGWQFDIPAASKPADGKLTVYATLASAFLTGNQELQLADDRNPAVAIQLAKDTSVSVRGIVVDGSSRAVAGARVSVAGYESEAVVTQAGGNFVLPAHAASGQQVQLHAERAGYAAVSQWHPAGDEPATLVLDRK